MLLDARRWIAAGGLAPLVLASVVSAQDGAAVWRRAAVGAVEPVGGLNAGQVETYRLDVAALAAVLERAPEEEGVVDGNGVTVELPLPGGRVQRFAVVRSSILPPGLAARYPGIQTYRGWGLDDVHASVRLDVTPAGVHAQVLSLDGAAYVLPGAGKAADVYRVFRAGDRRVGPPGCRVLSDGPAELPAGRGGVRGVGPVRRTFRLAVAATGEYTAQSGGTVAAAMAEIVTAVNMVTGIYEREASIRFVLAENTDLLIFTNAATDPYDNSNLALMADQNQPVVDSVIGPGNYDVGHVIGTADGGAAYMGTVCIGPFKARGASSTPYPPPDPYIVQVLAHELGHQFNAPHSFNGVGFFCSEERMPAGAFEPGSGSTIMAYAGFCGGDNLQPSPDLYFHAGSIEQITAWASVAGCAGEAATGNTAPVVSAGPGHTIPARTPFTLTATGFDPDGDVLTWSWEELDLGPAASLARGDNGQSPIIRSWPATTSPARTIPRLEELLANTTARGEILPRRSRGLSFRVTARDNRVGSGGVGRADTAVTVIDTGAPFRVTAPNGPAAWSGRRTVMWNVGGTAAAPIGVGSVRILLSTDGGHTYPVVLSAATSNDGAESVVLPDQSIAAARIRVEAVGNIFFDISNADFAVVPLAPGVDLSADGAVAIDDTGGNGNGNGRADPGESSVRVWIPIVNNGRTASAGVVGTLASLTPTVTVTSASAAYPPLGSTQAGTGLSPFVIAVSPAHVCGSPIRLRLTLDGGSGATPADVSIRTGFTGVPFEPVSFSYTGPAVEIPDGNTATASVPINVYDIGRVGGVRLRFDGDSCDAVPGSTTVGLDHERVGDLELTLTSPRGGTVLLASRPGEFPGSTGVNLCHTVFDDAGADGAFEWITAAAAPYSGSYTPVSPLASFIGQEGDGVWLVRARDLEPGFTGNIRAFTLIVTPSGVPDCAPPGTGACAADFDGNGAVAPADVSLFVLTWFTGVSQGTLAGDFDHNGAVEPADVAAFIAAWFNALNFGC